MTFDGQAGGGQRLTFRMGDSSRRSLLIGIAVGVLLAVIGLSQLGRDPGAGWTCLLVGGGFMLIPGSYFFNQVSVGSADVRIRQLFRTTTVPRSELRSIEVRPVPRRPDASTVYLVTATRAVPLRLVAERSTDKGRAALAAKERAIRVALRFDAPEGTRGG